MPTSQAYGGEVAAGPLVLRAGVGARPDRQGQVAGGRVERGAGAGGGQGAHGVARASGCAGGTRFSTQETRIRWASGRNLATRSTSSNVPQPTATAAAASLAWAPAGWPSTTGAEFACWSDRAAFRRPLAMAN